MKILVIRTDKIGEVLLTTPILTALKEKWPKAEISMMIRHEVRELIEDNPYVSEIIEYKEEGKIKANALRKKGFDIAIIVNPKKEFHLATFLAGIPIRVGFDRKWGFLLTHRVKDLKSLAERHEVEYNLDLVRALGIEPKDKRPVLVVKNSNIEIGRNKENGIIALHPGTSNPKKQWPSRYFAGLGDLLIERGCGVVVVGGPEERDVANEIISSMEKSPANLVGKTSLKDLALLFKKCDLLISADSGPVHIAAAVGTRVIALFGKEDPGSRPPRWGPYGEGHIVIEKERLEDITPQEVIKEIASP